MQKDGNFKLGFFITLEEVLPPLENWSWNIHQSNSLSCTGVEEVHKYNGIMHLS